jgi:uncharacterized protein (TIGR03437 family)
VEVFTQNGIWKGTVTLEAESPAFFGYTLNGRFYPSALIAGTGTIVAAAGALPGATTRPARAGDLVELYTNGLGATSTAVPPNEIPAQPLPVADLGRVRVTLGGRAAEVLFAGVTLAGAYQVNIRVPAGVAAGAQPLVLQVGSASAQEAFLTVGN